MKRIKLIFVLSLLVLSSVAQNLVPNPSFENYYNCNNFYINNIIDWELVNNGASSCGLLTCMTDPYCRSPRQYLDACFQSYQTVRTGTAYAEFGVYTTFVNSQESGHPACKLKDTLKAGSVYCVTYYVSMWNNARYSLDKLGALFTPTPFPYYVSGTTTPTFSLAGLYTPQIVTTPGVVFEDTLGWEEVSGTFTAVGNEAYLTLGDFFLHNQHFIKDSYPMNCNGLAEYYIDDVSVEEVHPAKAKNDTTIMFGDSTIIGNNPSEAALYNWQPSIGLSCTDCPNPKASPTITTTYTVTKTQCKAVTSDIIVVNVSPTGVNELNINSATQLMPNPSSGDITIKSKFVIDRVEIINTTGQLLLIKEIQSNEGVLDLSQFAEGIYFVKVVYPNGMSVTKKIVKE